MTAMQTIFHQHRMIAKIPAGLLAILLMTTNASAREIIRSGMTLTDGDSVRHVRDTTDARRIYVISGLGWGFTPGQTGDVLRPKFSNSLGLDISLADPKFFAYPLIDFLTFGYNQRVHDSDYTYDLENGRGNLYVLNLSVGYRRTVGQGHVYAFAGPGAAVIVEPRADVHEADKAVRIRNSTHITPTARGGLGVDYKIGGFYLFLESGWLHTFRQVQEHPVHAITLYGGLKTDVTRLKDNVARLIGIPANQP